MEKPREILPRPAICFPEHQCPKNKK